MQKSNSLTDLVGDLSTEVLALLRKEILLAKAEVGESIDNLLRGAGRLALGLTLAIGAVGVLLAGVVTGIATLLVRFGVDPDLAGTIAAFAVAVVFGSIGWLFVANAISALRKASLNLDRTLKSLADDAAAVGGKFE
jgi:hypothetical protein